MKKAPPAWNSHSRISSVETNLRFISHSLSQFLTTRHMYREDVENSGFPGIRIFISQTHLQFAGCFSKQSSGIQPQQESAMISNSMFLSHSRRIFAAALVAILGSGLSQAAWGQSAAPVSPQQGSSGASAPIAGAIAASATAQDPAALASANWARIAGSQKPETATNQGLKVHGHWIIDVKNPDGTLAQHRDFENSLQLTGQGYLVGLMSGYLVPGDYMLAIGASSGTSPCNAGSMYCGIVHNLNTYPALAYCGNYYCTGSSLTYSYNLGSDGFNSGPFSIVLAGSITANQTGTIGSVYSVISTCANIAFSTSTNPSTIESSSPATCVTQTSPEPWFGPLTQATFS
jgi:hypothetical protein